MDGVRVNATQTQDGHVLAHVTLPNGTPATFHYCPGQSEVVDEAAGAFCDALSRAVVLTLLDCAPRVPDAPEGSRRPCRICDAVTPGNMEADNGNTYCGDHRPGHG